MVATAVITPDRATFAPIDRSRSPVMMTKVAPTAAMPKVEIWSRIWERFRELRNTGEAIDKITNKMTMMAGTNVESKEIRDFRRPCSFLN